MDFLQQLAGNPLLMITVVLTLGVILVNGWTDAPNAIATCVSTRAMKASSAILMAAVFNFLGVLVMTMINSNVAMTIYNMVDFGTNTGDATIALCAALFAIVLWATVAWKFGIPTSESHALIAGLSGAAIALHGNLSGINPSEWVKVLYGLVLSTFLGFSFGFLCTRIIEFLFHGVDRRKANPKFKKAQVAAGAAMAFMHGAQDGQKFMGVIILSTYLIKGIDPKQMSGIDTSSLVWLMLICSLVMALGTMCGGKKIIKSVGMDMVKLEKYQGFSADIAGSLCLLLSSVFGIPMSTTHAKTTAIMGVGAVRRLSAINLNVVKEMALTWLLTFPGCGLISFIMAKIFIRIF